MSVKAVDSQEDSDDDQRDSRQRPEISEASKVQQTAGGDFESR